ncbi:MAG: MerC family mercury resistance protein, partial [Bacteroidia bacterium]|nr:MerC family mercury resistance protein [Bacteroidia bacterium]
MGIISSVLCLIHCLALPVLVSVQPLMFEYISEDLHALEYAFLIVSFVAVYFATRRASFAVKISFYLVLSLFMIGTAFGESLPWLHYLGYAGSAGLVTLRAMRILTGIQPSGGLTLGNYLGAIKRFVEMQDAGTHQTVYCMVDLHAITATLLDPDVLRNNTRELCAGFIASGIDPEKSILINQSQVPEHAQLAWIFNCIARMGWMGRMTQWK